MAVPSAYFPVVLNLAGKHCVVVGGGRVAERKVAALLDAGASVTVISPTITARLRRYQAAGAVTHRQRPFRKSDCRGAFLVIAATSDPAVNRRAAAASTCLANIVDDATASSCILPAVFRSGSLVIAVSTGGASPALAASIRSELEGLYGPSVGRYLTALSRLRKEVIETVPDRRQREALLRRLGSVALLRLLRRKGYQAALQQARTYILTARSRGTAERIQS